ncbi:hypothetical protein KM043_007774 [Ampulex compressa]|nr:hypothetical protein KM043_007774 [Ampulex compressa]
MTKAASISRLVAALSIVSILSEVTSYAKVPINNRGEIETRDGPISWISRALSRPEAARKEEDEGRSVKDIVITVSPVYVAPKKPKLSHGEAIDYPATPRSRYSTLDRDMIAKLDAASAKKKIQDRYHPTALNGHDSKNSNGGKQQMGPIYPTPVIHIDDPPNLDPAGQSFPGIYDYKPSDFLADKPISKPITSEDYMDSDIVDKPPDTYKSPKDSYHEDRPHGADFNDFEPGSPYVPDRPSKPIVFSGHLDRPPFSEDAYEHDHDYHHELIYDHVPEYHDHHRDQTEMPEMNDQRLDKRPYSYYFIGKKLWYVPLYFSIYFIIYIAALVLKSVARHKINLPAQLAELAGHSRGNDRDGGWWDLAGRVLEGVESFAEKFAQKTR